MTGALRILQCTHTSAGACLRETGMIPSQFCSFVLNALPYAFQGWLVEELFVCWVR